MAQTLSNTVVTAVACLARITAALVIVAMACGLALAAGAQSPQYVNTIAVLQESPGGQAMATLTPATPVTVLATQGKNIEVEVSGWSPAGGDKYLFKDVGLRINRAFLTEDGVSRRVVAGTKDDAWGSTWQDVKITGWINQDDLVADLDTIWKQAAPLYFKRCSRCHSLRRPQEFTANQWPHVLKIMTKRAGYSPEQAALVTALLQNHGKGEKVNDAFTQTETAAKAPTPEPPAIAKIVGTPAMAAKGAALFQSANCNACHGDDAKTPIMPEYPRLAGQSPEYLFKQIRDFESGARTNDPFGAMKDAVKPLSEDDARAIAYWLSTK